MDNIWRYTFHSESCVALEEYQVLPTETVSNPNANREQMTRIMFGTFNMVYAHFLAHHPSTAPVNLTNPPNKDHPPKRPSLRRARA